MDTTGGSNEALQATVARYLREGGWRFQATEQAATVSMLVQGRNGTWPCVLAVREAERQLLIYSLATFVAPEARRAAMMELLTRANFGMIIGNFEMNVDSGEIRYKTSIDVQDTMLERPVFDRLLDANFGTMDRYLPTLGAVAFSDISPAEALRTVEVPPATDA